MRALLLGACLAASQASGTPPADPLAAAEASPPPPEAEPPAPPEPRIAALDPAASDARIVVEMRLGGQVRGRFEHIEGELVGLPDGRCVVRVRLDAGRLRLEGPEWRVRMTRSEHFLDVENHPDIRFVSAPFDRQLLHTGGRLDGALRLRGQERPVAFALDPADCPSPGPGCALHVSGEISRREFGMAAYRLWIQDGVAFDFTVRLRQPDTP